MKNLPISPKMVLILLIAITAILAVLNLAGQFYVLDGGNSEMLLKAAGKLDLDGEKSSLPTWFQSSLMLFSAFLLLIIAAVRREAEDKNYFFWGFLSVVFIYLSLDETISIHEQLTVPLRQGLNLGGVFFMSWVVPVGIFVVIFFLLSLRFLSRLPAETRRMMILAGAIYVGGALGMEMIDGAYYEKVIEPLGGIADWNYVLMTTVEESLESLGLAVFIFTLLAYIQKEIFGVAAEKSRAEIVDSKIAVGKPAAARILFE